MKPAVTLFIDRSSWELTLLSATSSMPAGSGQWSLDDPESLAEAVAESLKEADTNVRRISIVLGSSLCLSSSFRCESTRQSRSREALLYRLEELIPLTAEDLLASFQRDGLSVFAVAARRAPITRLSGALYDNGIAVDLVTPEATLAWEQHFKTGKQPGRCAVIWQRNQHEAELAVFDLGHPVDWVHFPNGLSDLRIHLKADRLAHGPVPSVILYGPEHLSESVAGSVEELEVTEVRKSTGDPLRELAMRRVREIHAGRQRARYDLTPPVEGKGSSGRSPLRWDLAALRSAVLLLVGSVVISNWVAFRRLEGKTDQHVIAQEDLFRELFPDSRLPVGVRSRLKSELGKLAGVRGEADELVEPSSVLPSLYRCLRAVPDGMRLRIVSAKLDGTRIDLSGEVRQFADADRFAAALRAAGFRVTPPKTNRLPEEGVAFRLVANLSVEQEE